MLEGSCQLVYPLTYENYILQTKHIIYSNITQSLSFVHTAFTGQLTESLEPPEEDYSLIFQGEEMETQKEEMISPKTHLL